MVLSPTEDGGVVVLGVLSIVFVLAAIMVGVGFVGTSADLSPVGVAAGQSTNTTNRTANLSANATATPSANTTANRSQNATSLNATVVFANQTTNGSTVTVRKVTLPSPGFVALDSTGPGEEGPLEESTIAVSDRLSAGTHRNVTLQVNQSPPGGLVNRSALNNTGTYEAVLYRDSNNNSRFEFISSGRSTDRPFIVGSGANERLATDAARITVPQPQTPTPTASIRFTDQSATGSTVTVQSVTLPDGGFVVVHSEAYLRGGDPLQTVVGFSGYLSPGTHRNVSIRLTSGSGQQAQTLVAMPSRDTNGNRTYDYITSDGFQDVPYTASGEIVSDRAAVSGLAGTTTPSTTEAFASTTTTGALPATTTTPEPTATEQPAPTTTAGAESGGVGAWIASNTLLVVVIVLVVLAVLPTLLRRS